MIIRTNIYLLLRNSMRNIHLTIFFFKCKQLVFDLAVEMPICPTGMAGLKDGSVNASASVRTEPGRQR